MFGHHKMALCYIKIIFVSCRDSHLMENSNLSLTKICQSCGEKKPLTAFLQLTDAKSTTYGNICAACRKTDIERKKAQEKENTTSTTGVKIDSKTKVQSEIDKRELRKQTEED